MVDFIKQPTCMNENVRLNNLTLIQSLMLFPLVCVLVPSPSSSLCGCLRRRCTSPSTNASSRQAPFPQWAHSSSLEGSSKWKWSWSRPSHQRKRRGRTWGDKACLGRPGQWRKWRACSQPLWCSALQIGSPTGISRLGLTILKAPKTMQSRQRTHIPKSTQEWQFPLRSPPSRWVQTLYR